MAIENTTKRDPLVHLIGAMSDGTSGYIEGMERDGQRSLVHSDRLPTDTSGRDDEYVALGFIFGPPDPNDPMFRPATLPTGWTRRGSDHAMWSYIDDRRGIERVAIFYKAAFYDRSAHMSLTNVGGNLASKLVYGDEPVKKIVVPWDSLTQQERDDMIGSLRHEATRERYDLSKGYGTRAEAALARFGATVEATAP